MPDRRSHRGAHPEDPRLFAPSALPAIRRAVTDLGWLQGRGYAETAALQLVGDRYQLEGRQRVAVRRAACAEAARRARAARSVSAEQIAGGELWIDAFNVLNTVEAALSGGVILRCRDGCLRDLAGVGGTWRRVEETDAALAILVGELVALGVARCRWLLDRPVSNSGRLAGWLREVARDHRLVGEADLVDDADAVLIAAGETVASSDSHVLDRCARWFNLAHRGVQRAGADVWLVDLAAGDAGGG